MADDNEIKDPEEDLKESETAEETSEKEAEEKEEKEASDPEDSKKDKKKKPDRKVEELKEKIKELEDFKLRQMAEFQNFRTRSEKEKSQMFDLGSKNVIEKILPVVDNFERGLAAVKEDDNSAFIEGMTMVYKQLMTELENLGVKPIEAVGQEFNPDLHNAVMQVEKEGVESGTIVEELQKGYTYHDMVVRHSMVSVAQ